VLQGVQPALQQLVRNLGSSGVWLVSAVARILDVASDAESLPSAQAGADDTVSMDGMTVHIRDLTFAYSSTAAPVVRDLTLTIGPGDHVAIVGPSGAGKSTLAALIAGLLEPQQGTVRLGSMDATTVRVAAPHVRALIPQEAYVFSGTLFENVTYLNPDVPRDEVERAIETLGAAPLVQRLGGCDAAIDPSTLSAGERQLLTLVRAYVSRAPVILLDEATCHLDPEAEAHAEHAFARRGGTLVVIAHRISSAMRARRVLLLDGGEALLGTHVELLERSELYRNLVGYWSGDGTVAGDGDDRAARRNGMRTEGVHGDTVAAALRRRARSLIRR
jgi:ATP-binding cassette subfamily C protein